MSIPDLPTKRSSRTSAELMPVSSISSFVPGAVFAALKAGVRAPSPHNTQPWKFRVNAERIEVWLDEKRVLKICDPDAREARLACGAAILNIRLSLAVSEQASTVKFVPDPRAPTLLGVINAAGYYWPNPDELSLSKAIPRRYTNRRPFLDSSVSVHERHVLSEAARVEGARLTFLDPTQLNAFAALLRQAERIQSDDPAFLKEIAQWTPADHREDGVPTFAGGPRPIDGTLLSMRRFDNSTATVDRAFEQDPLVAVLTTPSDTPEFQLRAGQAMQRVLLAATAKGLSASFLSQPVEVAPSRAVLQSLMGEREYPQTVLRIGHGPPGASTPRRPIAAVTEVVKERLDI